MHLYVELAYVIQGSNSLQAWRHVMEVCRDSIPLQSRRVGLCTIEDFISSCDVLHPLLHVSWHLSDDAVVFVHGIACATPQSFGYLLWYELCHFLFDYIFSYKALQAFASLLAAQSVGISLCSSSMSLLRQSGQYPVSLCRSGSGQGIVM